jgi:hypothetical protein
MRHNPECDDQGRLHRWHIACTDIEERRIAEERLQRENRALREEVDTTSMFEEIVGASSALSPALVGIAGSAKAGTALHALRPPRIAQLERDA